MVTKYILERLTAEGDFVKVIHMDGYIHLFDSFEGACASSRGLRETYGTVTAVQPVQVPAKDTRLFLSPEEEERWREEYGKEGKEPTMPAICPDPAPVPKPKVVAGKRRIRIRKG